MPKGSNRRNAVGKPAGTPTGKSSAPGQMKQAAGAKSAKSFAPGQANRPAPTVKVVRPTTPAITRRKK